MPIIRFGLEWVSKWVRGDLIWSNMRSSMSMFDCRVLVKAIVLLYWPIGSINCVKHRVSCPSLLARQHLIQEHVNVLPIPHESDDTDPSAVTGEPASPYALLCPLQSPVDWTYFMLRFRSTVTVVGFFIFKWSQRKKENLDPIVNAN